MTLTNDTTDGGSRLQLNPAPVNQHPEDAAHMMPKPSPRPSAVNVTNEYLTVAFLRDKEEARDYAKTHLLGEWKPTSLKPCPFCGSVHVKENTRRKSCVECVTCGAEGPTGREAERAIELWNERKSQ